MKRKILLVAWVATTLLEVSLAQRPPCANSLSGTVFMAPTGEPMPYVNIVVKELNIGTISDDEGHFLIQNLCDSTYTVVCSHIGCEHEEEQVLISGNTKHDFWLHHAAHLLESVVVSTEGVPLKPLRGEASLTGDELAKVQSLPLAEALKSLPGLTTLTTGSTISKPVIRGMHSNRIVLLQNGVRQESQQWGSEHAPEIDPFAAERLSVVKGAAGVEFGPEAIGGVVLAESKPLPTEKGIHGAAHLSGASNGWGGAASAMIEGKFSDKIPLSASIQGTLRRAGNLRTPDYFLANTGLSEQHFSWRAGWLAKSWSGEAFYNQFNQQLGIFSGSHIGNLTDLENAIRSETPLVSADFNYEIGRPKQAVEHEMAGLEFQYKTENSGKFKTRLARQFNRRQEFDAHGSAASGDEPQMEFEITSYTADAIWEHQKWGNWHGKIGAQLLFQENTTDRGGLIPDYASNSAGIFWLEKWRNFPNPWEFEAGLRYDFKNLEARIGTPEISKNYQFHNVTATAGARYHFHHHWQTNWSVGNAWRAPNVNELFSDGVHHGAASYETGDSNLKAEKAWQASWGVETVDVEWLEVNVSAYFQLMEDFIYLQPDDEFVLTIRGAFPAFSYRQTTAALYGFDGKTDWKLGGGWETGANFSVLRARNLDDSEWLPLMPADRVGIFGKYIFGKNDDAPYLQVEVNHVFRQARTPADTDFAPAPGAYTLLGLDAGWKWNFKTTKMSIGAQVQNLLDERYRDYMNRFRYFADEAGRNVSLRLKFEF